MNYFSWTYLLISNKHNQIIHRKCLGEKEFIFWVSGLLAILQNVAYTYRLEKIWKYNLYSRLACGVFFFINCVVAEKFLRKKNEKLFNERSFTYLINILYIFMIVRFCLKFALVTYGLVRIPFYFVSRISHLRKQLSLAWSPHETFQLETWEKILHAIIPYKLHVKHEWNFK